MALTSITTGMEKGPEAIEANFNTLGQFGNSKCVAISTVSTMLNGLKQNIGGHPADCPCSFEVVDPINRVARISFEMGVGWPDGYYRDHGGLQPYTTVDVFQFSSSLFKSVLPNTPLIGRYTFNQWGQTVSTYINDHTVGFKVDGVPLNTDGQCLVACSFLAYY